MFDLDQSEDGVQNTIGNFEGSPLKYSDAYIRRNQPTTGDTLGKGSFENKPKRLTSRDLIEPVDYLYQLLIVDLS